MALLGLGGRARSAARDVGRRILGSRRSSPQTKIHPRVRVTPDAELRQAERGSLNRLCDISDWKVDSPLTLKMRELGEGVYVHRKAWEYAIAILGLEQLGVVAADARALAVGAGSERPLYYFANHIREMVATDLYDSPGQEGTPEMLEAPEQFAPFDYRRENLHVAQMNGTALQFVDETFDFSFSLSSIEHFGTRDQIKKAVQEMSRVVRPGGSVCITTELILNQAAHAEYFRVEELEETVLAASPDLELVGGPLDLRISQSAIEHPIDLDIEMDHQVSPHIVLYSGGVLWTSISLFFRRH